MKSHPRRFAQFFVWWKDGSWEAAATYNGALDTAPTARVTGLGTANVKAERRHTASALPECLEESAELALRALERVLPPCESIARQQLRTLAHSTQRPLRV